MQLYRTITVCDTETYLPKVVQIWKKFSVTKPEKFIGIWNGPCYTLFAMDNTRHNMQLELELV